MGADRGHVGRGQGGDHQSQEPRGEEDEHGRVGQVVSQERGVDPGEGGLDVLQRRVDDEGGQRHQDPGPGPEPVVGGVEPEDRLEGFLLVPGGEHPLGGVPPAAG